MGLPSSRDKFKLSNTYLNTNIIELMYSFFPMFILLLTFFLVVNGKMIEYVGKCLFASQEVLKRVGLEGKYK